MQSKKPKGARTQQIASPNNGRPIARSTGVHNVQRLNSVDRPVDHSKENGRPAQSTDWHAQLSVGFDRPIGQPKGWVGRPTGGCFFYLDSDFVSELESNPICGFLKPCDSLTINKGI